MEETPLHHDDGHITLPSDMDYKDMTPCECLTAVVDIFFDALANVTESSTVKVVNYMSQKISHRVVDQHLNDGYQTHPKQSPRVQWMSLLQGFTSSLHASDLSEHSLRLLTLVDILENVKKCSLGKQDAKTFRLLVQLFISVSGFPELQGDEDQQTIFELQQEANNQELIHHYLNKETRSEKIEKLREAHPILEFCDKIRAFVHTLITEKCQELIPKIEQSNQEQQQEDMVDDIEFGIPEFPLIEPTSPSVNEEDTPSVVSPEDKQESATSRKSRQTSNSLNKRSHKTPRRWSPSEESNLVKGIEQYGAGNWKEILANYKFEDRNASDLLAKWRLLEKKKRACARTAPYVTKRMTGAISERKLSCERRSQTPTVAAGGKEEALNH